MLIISMAHKITKSLRWMITRYDSVLVLSKCLVSKLKKLNLKVLFQNSAKNGASSITIRKIKRHAYDVSLFRATKDYFVFIKVINFKISLGRRWQVSICSDHFLILFKISWNFIENFIFTWKLTLHRKHNPKITNKMKLLD